MQKRSRITAYVILRRSAVYETGEDGRERKLEEMGSRRRLE